jgi:STAS domain
MCGLGLQKSMMLKIERISGKRRTQIRLSGELRAEQLEELKNEIERAGSRVALDLEEVHLVDIEAVRFLNACVACGFAVLHASPYIKEWMFREQGP